MDPVLANHLAAIEASLGVVHAQLAALRHALTPPASAQPDRAEACPGQSSCARVDEDARQARSSFGDPQAWLCATCGATGSGA